MLRDASAALQLGVVSESLTGSGDQYRLLIDYNDFADFRRE